MPEEVAVRLSSGRARAGYIVLPQVRSIRPLQGNDMMATELRLPELGAVAGTRAMLGAGVALLLADRLSASQRKGRRMDAGGDRGADDRPAGADRLRPPASG
jgi:hypothetical protein